MGKHRLIYALSAATMLAGVGGLPSAAWAEGISTVSTFDELDAALCAGGNIEISADIAVDGWLGSACNYIVDKDTTVDFKGHTITSAENRGYNIDFRDATLTFEDSVGGGGYTQLGTDNTAIAITNGKFILNSGTITANTWGVVLWHDSEFEMNGGAINAENLAISGNGTTDPAKANYGSNVKITINDGELISATDWAIYNPSENSTIDIYGGKITGASGALAANRGTINIYDGEFTSLGTAEVDGDVSQDGTRGYENAVIGIPKEYGPVILNIYGGKFVNQNGAELIADVSGLDNENEATIEISGGQFAVQPSEDEIGNPDENEADIDEETGMYTIFPKRVDVTEQGAMESDDSKYGAVAGTATFTQEFIADRKAYFEISTLDDDEFESLAYTDANGELVVGFDVSLWDRDGVVIDVHDTEIEVKIALTDEQYSKLAAYDKVIVINYDEQGNEVERFDATLAEEDGVYYVEFTTTHMSTYAVAGVNEESVTETSETGSTSAVASPETGSTTAAGASATGAAIVTAVAVGLLASVVSFMYLMRRR